MSTKESYDVNRRLRAAEGEQQHHIDVFGDRIAEKYGYKRHSGIEAVWFFLIQQHHWTPAVVRALNTSDLYFLLEEEMADWTLPPDAKP